jgi:hypothetical protein
VPLLALASWRLRPANVRQLTAVARRPPWRWTLAGRPPVGDHPVRWKEQYVERVLDLPGLRQVPRGLGVAAAFAAALVTSPTTLNLWLPRAGGPVIPWSGFFAQGFAVAFLAGLAAGARACGAVSGERERRTWEALLLTPLTDKQLVRSKVWGAVNVFRPYLLAYTLPAVGLALAGGGVAVVCAVNCWVVTWVMMYHMAACGIASSVRSASAWRSWLATLLGGYRGMLGIFALVGAPCGLMGAGLLQSALMALGPASPGWYRFVFLDLFPVSLVCLSALVTAALLFARSEQQLTEAEQHLGRTERVPQRLPARPVVPAAAPGR